MATITAVKLTLTPNPSLRTVDVVYEYTIEFTPKELRLHASFQVSVDLVGVDSPDPNDSLGSGLDLHTVSVPATGSAPVTVSRKISVGYSLLNEDRYQDEIRLDVNAKPLTAGGGTPATGQSNTVTGNFD